MNKKQMADEVKNKSIGEYRLYVFVLANSPDKYAVVANTEYGARRAVYQEYGVSLEKHNIAIFVHGIGQVVRL